MKVVVETWICGYGAYVFFVDYKENCGKWPNPSSIYDKLCCGCEWAWQGPTNCGARGKRDEPNLIFECEEEDIKNFEDAKKLYLLNA